MRRRPSAISTDAFHPVFRNLRAQIVGNGFTQIVFDVDVHVFLSIHEELLTALFILEAKLIEVIDSATFGTAGLDCGARSIIGQRVWNGLIGIVDGAGDDGMVGISFQEANDDFLANTRDEDGSPALTSPRLCNAHPAGTLIIALALAVPEKLDLHAAELIDADFLARAANNDAGLGSLHEGFWSETGRPERSGRIDRSHVI